MFDFYNVLKIAIVLVLFYFIKQMDIPDSYKFLLTVVPSLLLLSTNYVIRAIQFSGKNKPLMLKRKDTASDKPIIDEYFFESFVGNNNTNFFVETHPDSASATLFEQEKPFWVQNNNNNNYFDISNPHNFIALDHLPMGANYTLEFWLRLHYVSNNAVAAFYAGDNLLFDISYDEKHLQLHNTKIPLPGGGAWFHLVLMRGQADTLGTNRGLLYINGLFHSYVPNLPNLQDMTKTFLFKYSLPTPPLRYNKKYHDVANAALVRFYSRSLTLDEIQNNFLKDAYTYDLQEENMTASRTHVQGNHLLLYLDARPPRARARKSSGSGGAHEVIYKTKNNNKNNSIVLQDIPLQHNWLSNFNANNNNTNNTNNKNNKNNKKRPKMLFQYTTKTTTTTTNNKNKNQTGKPIF
jgi:hypothetical protein